MLDILQEKPQKERIVNQFLGANDLKKLQRIFGAKRAGGKLKIEVGLQDLVLKKKNLENGWYGRQMRLSFWKPPASFDGLRTKVGYSTIDAIHVLRDRRYISFKENWYKNYTVGLDEKSFKAVKEGDRFLCLVEQSEKKFYKDGENQRYVKGNRIGEEIVVVDCNIRKVYPPDYDKSKIEFNYIDLYKFLEE